MKDALRAAITKRDELYNKVIAFDQALKTQKARTHQKEVECSQLQRRVEELITEREELVLSFSGSIDSGSHKYTPSFDTQ